MNIRHADIVVAGGGIAGLTATAALAGAGFKVICVEPQAPVTDSTSADADLRSTAFLEPSVDLLRDAGLWPGLAPFATDLAVMRLADAGGPENTLREVADFEAVTLGQPRFGVNLPNWVIRREMTSTLATLPDADVLTGLRVTRSTPRSREMILALSDGSQIRAALAVAADGRDSPLRAAAGIGTRRWDYGQQALVFAVSHPLPHENTSTEIHRSGGPFTLVPLPDQDGVPHSAVVWMETGPRSGNLQAMGPAEFEAALNQRACNVLGPLSLASPIARWPIASQIAARFDAPRLALVAEAAHVMPPIGAQGLNTSLADIGALRDLLIAARDAGRNIGDASLLARFNRARYADTLARILGIDALNRAAMVETPRLRDLRNAGLRVLRDVAPLKQTAMRMGLGA